MGSLLGIDSVALTLALIAVASGAATLLLIVRGATYCRRPAVVARRSQLPGRIAAIATLEAVYLRGDITYEDYVALSRKLLGG